MHLIRALLPVDVAAIQVGEIICFKPFKLQTSPVLSSGGCGS